MRKLLLFVLLSVGCLSTISAQIFSEILSEAGISHFYEQSLNMGGGVVFFDANGDGFDDIYLTSGYRADKFYENNQDGTFTDKTTESGLENMYDVYTTGAISGDTDNDGDQDLFVYTWFQLSNNSNEARSLFYENQGDGTFIERGEAAGFTIETFTMAATMVDYDLDGFLDIYAGNYVESGTLAQQDLQCFPNQLYRNNGNGTFTNVAGALGVASVGCALAAKGMNWDLDEDPDIYVANDFGGYDIAFPNNLYNNNNGQFSDVAANANALAEFYAMGITNGDYDMDGDLDVYITNLGKNALLRDDGSSYTHQEDIAGVGNEFALDAPGNLLTTGWGTAFLDYDNNLWPDLFVANGRVPAAPPVEPTGEQDPNKLYRNNQDGTFTDISLAAGVENTGRGRGLAFSDFDNDGDLDVFIVNQDADPEHAVGPFSSVFYRNDIENENHYLKLTLEGTVNNRDGYGALIKVFVDEHILLREHTTGGSHCSQHSSTIHFGLGEYSAVDSIQVVWPGGTLQSILPEDQNLSANQTIHITEAAETDFVFSSFEVAREDVGVRLTWSGNQIVNNLGFDIERSSDGVTFQVIADQQVNVNNQYLYIDTTAPSGVRHYYRIKQNSPSQFVYSAVRTIIFFGKSGFPLTLQPSGQLIELDWTSPVHEDLNAIRLQRSLSETGNFTTIQTFSANDSGIYQYDDVSINTHQIYFYRLEALIDNHPQIITDPIRGYVFENDNLSLFTAATNQSNLVLWQSEFEVEDSRYELLRKTGNSSNFEVLQQITVDLSNDYAFEDFSADPLVVYDYQVRMIDGFGEQHYSTADQAAVIPKSTFSLSADDIQQSLVELSWDSNPEINTATIHIERRELPNGQFESIHTQQPIGQTSYTFIDETTTQASSYEYQIRQTDVYGYSLFSEVSSIELTELEEVWTVMPNPATELLFVQHPRISDFQHFYVFDTNGRQVMSYGNEAINGLLVLDVRLLSPGYYFLHCTAQGGEEKTLQFMVK